MIINHSTLLFYDGMVKIIHQKYFMHLIEAAQHSHLGWKKMSWNVFSPQNYMRQWQKFLIWDMPKNQKWLMPMIPNISAYKYYSFCRSEMSSFNNVNIKCAQSLVPHYMTLQRWPNRTELRSMDSYIQILCIFQKWKRKVPPPLLLSNEKSPFNPPKEDFSHLIYLLLSAFIHLFKNLDGAWYIFWIKSLNGSFTALQKKVIFAQVNFKLS